MASHTMELHMVGGFSGSSVEEKIRSFEVTAFAV